MGWTLGWDNRRDLVEEITRSWTDNDGTTTTCIRRYFSGNDLWTVWERTGQASPARHIVLFMLRRYGNEWGYKDVTESMGPYQTSCPLGFLDLVTDPGGFATEWRKKVRAAHTARSGVMVGQVIGDVAGVTGGRLTITSVRPLRGVSDSGRLYRIPKYLLAQRTGVRV